MTDATKVERAGTWTKLRDRKVVQWGLVYVAAAWGFLQGLAYVSDSFHWPEQLRQIALLALLIGLPIVLVLAWYHGDRGRQRASVTELAVLVLLLLAGGLVLWRYQHATQTARVAISSASMSNAKPIVDDKSIAVLPFVNMSSDKEQEYFTDGISEELLNLLARIPELRVIGRTSSFQFKGKNEDLRVIGQKLSVAHLLEGSVRKSGDKIRLTAQLIRADDGSNLWSETYDRTLDDIFVVQDEIAGEVVKALKVTLLGAAPTVRETNPEAYSLYLQARQLGRQFAVEALKQSDALYQKVLAIDPDYAPAWAGMSANSLNNAGVGLRSYEQGLRLAREATNKALALDPKYAPAHASLGFLATRQGDLAGAARHFERALALNPSDLEILQNAALLLSSLGRLNEAIAIEEYVVTRDPVDPEALYYLGVYYTNAGRFDEAINQYRTALSLEPGRGVTHFSIGAALLFKGQPAAALAEMQQETIEVWRMIGLPMAYHALGRTADSDAATAALKTKYEKDWSYQIAQVHAFGGQADSAFEWLDKAVKYDDIGLSEILTENLFANIHNDPRWLPFLRKIGKAPEQLAAIKFDVKVPK